MRASKRSASGPPAKAGCFVQGALAKLGVAPGWQAVAGWAEVCGPLIAARTAADRVTNGVLYVRVASSSWASELTFVKKDLLRRLRETVGGGVRDLRFEVGQLPERSADLPLVTQAAVRPAHTAPPALVEPAVAAIEDPELRAALRSLGARILRDE